ncbi:hypothetical protein AcW1_003294 [Taiwanofungus camphoratus]|nr:hypothetical protein AcW1_003294 [Antrodia cinnamomea]
MSHDIIVTFLGTTSGGGPTDTRNCSSLVIEPLGDGSLWMVDCAEGTVRQFALQPFHDARRLKMSKISKIFITHMHADHTMGLLTILRNVLGIPKPPAPNSPTLASTGPPRIDIYGPSGLRRYLRTLVALTHTRTAERYAVHELLGPDEQPSIFAGTESNVVDIAGPLEEGRLENEAPGRDVMCDTDGFWRDIVIERTVGGRKSEARVTVDAGPIAHRDPCIGYIIREIPRKPFAPSTPVPRKVVVLGDTSDPSTIFPLIESPSLSTASVRSSGNAIAGPSNQSASTIGITPNATSTSHKSEFSDEELTVDEIAFTPTPVSLLVHEATDAFMPPSIDPQQRTGRHRTFASVAEKARERGHSTPAMAGAFARQIDAERLILNHIGSRFPAPAYTARSASDRFRLDCMREIERQATQAWAPSHRTSAQAAWDFMRVVLPPNSPSKPVFPSWPLSSGFDSVYTPWKLSPESTSQEAPEPLHGSRTSGYHGSMAPSDYNFTVQSAEVNVDESMEVSEPDHALHSGELHRQSLRKAQDYRTPREDIPSGLQRTDVEADLPARTSTSRRGNSGHVGGRRRGKRHRSQGRGWGGANISGSITLESTTVNFDQRGSRGGRESTYTTTYSQSTVSDDTTAYDHSGDKRVRR